VRWLVDLINPRRVSSTRTTLRLVWTTRDHEDFVELQAAIGLERDLACSPFMWDARAATPLPKDRGGVLATAENLCSE
jgi:hypothetical protein